MTPEQAEFIKQICTNPKDDTVRLVYADWLDENDQEDRAEFVRTQVQIAKKFKRRVTHGNLLPTHSCRKCDGLWHAAGGGYWRVVSDVGVCCTNTPPLSERMRQLSPGDADLFRTEKALLRRAAGTDSLDNETAWLQDFLLLIMAASPAVREDQPRNEGRVFWWEWSRGFLSEFTLDPVAWAACADKLLWSKTGTASCPACVGTKGHVVPPGAPHRTPANAMTLDEYWAGAKQDWRGQTRTRWEKCVACDGTGRGPRPVCATTTPVERVTLAWPPDYKFLEDGRARLAGREKTHWVPRGEGYDHSRRGIAQTLCELEWPGVEFTIEMGPGHEGE